MSPPPVTGRSAASAPQSPPDHVYKLTGSGGAQALVPERPPKGWQKFKAALVDLPLVGRMDSIKTADILVRGSKPEIHKGAELTLHNLRQEHGRQQVDDAIRGQGFKQDPTKMTVGLKERLTQSCRGQADSTVISQAFRMGNQLKAQEGLPSAPVLQQAARKGAGPFQDPSAQQALGRLGIKFAGVQLRQDMAASAVGSREAIRQDEARLAKGCDEAATACATLMKSHKLTQQQALTALNDGFVGATSTEAGMIEAGKAADRLFGKG